MFRKTAGRITDMTNDPGIMWNDVISHFWPSDIEKPDLGFDKSACLSEINGMPSYPVHTAEHTLLSSMYFLAGGASSMDPESMVKVAAQLKEYRDAWEVEIPAGFISFLKTSSVREEVAPAEPEPREMSKNAAGAIVMRMRVMQPLTNLECHDYYMDKMAELYQRVKQSPSPSEAEAIARELEDIDLQTEMDVGWENYYPNPDESIFSGVNLDPMPKNASLERDYSDVDWGGLSNVFSEDVVSQIKDDPESVIPTLPMQQRMLVEDYIKNA